MKHKLSMEAATAYATLLNEYVDADERDNFSEDFEEFLDAYDADIKAEKINVDVKASGDEGNAEEMIQTIKDALKNVTFKFEDPRAIPKVGEIYRDTLNYRLKILAVLNDANGYIILMQNCSDFLKSSIRLMTLTDFEKLTVYKED